MKQKLIELRKLAHLSELIQDQDLARLAEVSTRVEGGRARVSELELELTAFLNAPVTNKFEIAARMNTEWQDWRRAQALSLNAALANLEAERESIRVMAKRSFGRTQVVRKIIDKVQVGEA